MSKIVQKRLYDVPWGLILSFLWIGIDLFHSAPNPQDFNVIMGLSLTGTYLSIYWLINKTAALVVLLSPAISNQFPKLKRVIPKLMLTYIGWHLLSTLILSFRILFSSDFHNKMKSMASISGASSEQEQLLMGMFSLIPALIALLMFYLTYINREYFLESNKK